MSSKKRKQKWSPSWAEKAMLDAERVNKSCAKQKHYAHSNIHLKSDLQELTERTVSKRMAVHEQQLNVLRIKEGRMMIADQKTYERVCNYITDATATWLSMSTDQQRNVLQFELDELREIDYDASARAELGGRSQIAPQNANRYISNPTFWTILATRHGLDCSESAPVLPDEWNTPTRWNLEEIVELLRRNGCRVHEMPSKTEDLTMSARLFSALLSKAKHPRLSEAAIKFKPPSVVPSAHNLPEEGEAIGGFFARYVRFARTRQNCTFHNISDSNTTCKLGTVHFWHSKTANKTTRYRTRVLRSSI